MRWWHPADLGFAVRGKLADLGTGTRLFLRLLALTCLWCRTQRSNR